ncbi:MAG: glutamate--tRNA ligase [Desulfobacterales bacterium]
MEKVITRFPPSPTGYLHIGGARTALFNWLYARHMNGRFVLRIEDTDVRRSTKESVDAIFDALTWLGIDWDEGPWFQSQRFELYREYIQKLVASGHAYYCTCSVEKLEAMRQKAMAEGTKPKYDGTCREKCLEQSPDAVVRFKAPLAGTTTINDVIKGPIVFQNTEIDDFIIQRSDGTPTYHLAVVVDDITMKINTIIRGDDHVNNTPKQILLYGGLGEALPVYGHVPMVLGSDRTRLSKRHGAMSVTAYRDMGYLPEALLNYLVRLGWSYGDQEFFTVTELIEKFSLENIGKSAGIFNPEKLLALNADHIQAARPERLQKPLLPFLLDKGFSAKEGDYLVKVIQTLQPRSKTLVEMAEGAAFYFKDDIRYEEKAADKFLKPETAAPMDLLAKGIANMAPFTEAALEDLFRQVMAETGLKLGKIAQPVRVALTGKTASPGIFEIIEVLGKERTVHRLNKAIEFIEKRR